MVFVFGSNLAGVHGAGAAKFALEHKGAVWGKGYGHYGNSYALPTKNSRIETMSLMSISGFISDFVFYAKKHPELTFQVTAVGCGLAGLRHEQVAPLFEEVMSRLKWNNNLYFDTKWAPYLGDVKYWGEG